MTKKYKLTSQKSSKGLKSAKQKSASLKNTLSSSKAQSKTSPTFKPTASNPWESLPTNTPRSVNVDDLLKPTLGEPKKQRGRPRKDGATSSVTAPGAASSSTSANVSPGGISATSALQSPSYPIAPSALKPLLNGPFFLMSRWLDDEDCNLTDREIEELHPSAEAVAKQYAGMMNSPHAALYALSISICLLGVGKYVQHAKKAPVKEKEELEKAQEPPKPGDPNNPFLTEVIK